MDQIYQTLDQLFEDFALSLDLTPTQINRAISISENLQKWIAEKDFDDGTRIKVYTQGSMRLGTTVKPYKKERDKEYDVDIVAEIENATSNQQTDPKSIKFLVRDRIIANEIYRKKLIDKESKLCWKLVFEPETTAHGDIGFHVDILPAITHNPSNFSILHPIKEEEYYRWKESNPEGFAKWFDELNDFPAKNEYYEKYRQEVFSTLSENYKDRPLMMNFSEAVEIPDTFVRTPLQRSVQLLKRNRDIFNANSNMKIDSIIITRLAAGLYNGEQTTFGAFANITNRLLMYNHLFENENFSILNESNSFLKKDLITRKYDQQEQTFIWVIENPCNPNENYASRWHEDNNAQAKYFFSWLDHLHRTLNLLKTQTLLIEGPNTLAILFGEESSKAFFKEYGEKVKLLRKDGKLKNSSKDGLSTEKGEKIKNHNFWG